MAGHLYTTDVTAALGLYTLGCGRVPTAKFDVNSLIIAASDARGFAGGRARHTDDEGRIEQPPEIRSGGCRARPDKTSKAHAACSAELDQQEKSAPDEEPLALRRLIRRRGRALPRDTQPQAERERRTRAGRAFDAHLAVEQREQLAADGEPETGAAVFEPDLRVGLRELFEDVREAVVLDADAGVGDGEPERRVRMRRDRGPSPRRGRFRAR